MELSWFHTVPLGNRSKSAPPGYSRNREKGIVVRGSPMFRAKRYFRISIVIDHTINLTCEDEAVRNLFLKKTRRYRHTLRHVFENCEACLQFPTSPYRDKNNHVDRDEKSKHVWRKEKICWLYCLVLVEVDA